jgi:hypothetical protein
MSRIKSDTGETGQEAGMSKRTSMPERAGLAGKGIRKMMTEGEAIVERSREGMTSVTILIMIRKFEMTEEIEVDEMMQESIRVDQEATVATVSVRILSSPREARTEKRS